MYKIFYFLICFFYSYLFSCFFFNNPYYLFFSVQYFSSVDFSLIRILFDSFSDHINQLGLQKSEINLEVVAESISNEYLNLKKNMILSIYILYDLSLLKEMYYYLNLLNICLNDLFFLYNFFDFNITNELINTNYNLYLMEEYKDSLKDSLIFLKNTDYPYVHSELYIKNFINEIIT